MEVQKYYVIKNEEPILVKDFICEGDNYGKIVQTKGLKISEIDPMFRSDYHLTEEEIKDYGEEYMKYTVFVRKGWND